MCEFHERRLSAKRTVFRTSEIAPTEVADYVRVATKAFIEQTTTLNQRLGELSQAASQSQEVAKQNVALKSDVIALRERLDAFEAQARTRKPDAPAQPKPSAEDKW